MNGITRRGRSDRIDFFLTHFSAEKRFFYFQGNALQPISRRIRLRLILIPIRPRWIFYERRDFDPHGVGRVEYGWGDGFCHDLDYAGDLVESVRYAGVWVDRRVDAVNLYLVSFFRVNRRFPRISVRNVT